VSLNCWPRDGKESGSQPVAAGSSPRCELAHDENPKPPRAKRKPPAQRRVANLRRVPRVLSELERFLASSARWAGECIRLDEQKAAGERYLSAMTPKALERIRKLAATLESAVILGRPETVEWLVAQLETRKRLTWVQSAAYAARCGPGVEEGLKQRLAAIDPAAATLDVTRIRSHLERYGRPLAARSTSGNARDPLKTPHGLAARLAVECGAFGYGSSDAKKAKEAFAKVWRAHAGSEKDVGN
jgi:hypothetical protein